jgi:hypothetical protein
MLFEEVPGLTTARVTPARVEIVDRRCSCRRCTVLWSDEDAYWPKSLSAQVGSDGGRYMFEIVCKLVQSSGNKISRLSDSGG